MNNSSGNEEYKSNLSEKYLEIAKELIGETEPRKEQCLQELRELIKKNENIKYCRTGE